MTTAVKICGINSEPALKAALDGGADYVGFVFFAKSPRNLQLSEAKRLRALVPRQGPCKTVALLVDPDDSLISDIISTVDPDMIQLHGHESVERVTEIRARFARPILKAIPVATAADVEKGLAYLKPSLAADLLLFDAMPDPKAALPGGNGLAFDWHILEAAPACIPFALAGGLTPDNVAEAIARTHASIVDVSSGVESAPGRKDPGLIRRFLQAAKGAKQAPDNACA